MKNLIIAAAILAIGMPIAASAQAMSSAASGTVVCAPAKAGETSNATMGSTQLVCHKVDVAKVMAAEKKLMGMMPKGMSADQMKSANTAQMTIHQELMLPVIPGTNGNPNN
jgi:hypothetical protein